MSTIIGIIYIIFTSCIFICLAGFIKDQFTGDKS